VKDFISNQLRARFQKCGTGADLSPARAFVTIDREKQAKTMTAVGALLLHEFTCT
jgi:hypothetical protein